MSNFHRDEALKSHAVIRHHTDGTTRVTYHDKRETADDAAVGAMNDPNCLYAYVVKVRSRLSNLPAIARRGAPA